ncbi:MAG TPA: hypothetical protein VIW68_11050 [Candidatus Sulfotelmatobacter sp.]
MPIHPSNTPCTHIKVTGVQCGSPALRGEQFCYFHQRMIRGVQVPPQQRLHPVALIEDEEAIQSSLMEVINALIRNTIDLRRADLILKALSIAVKNSRRVRFAAATDMIAEAPAYPVPKPAAAAQSVTAAGVKVEGADAGATRTNAQVSTAPTSAPAHTEPSLKASDPTQRKPPSRAGNAPPLRKAAVKSARST